MREAERSPAVLKSEIDKYGIDYFIMRNSAHDARLMADAGPMRLDFADVRYFLYTRNAANFPISGLLWARPHCWDSSLADDIKAEQARANQILPNASPLHALLEIASLLSQPGNQDMWLPKLEEMTGAMDSVKQFSGYRALEIGENSLAIKLFNNVASPEPKDYLAVSLAYLRSGDVDRAEEVLDRATRIQWERLEFVDLLILHGLLSEIQDKRPLEYIQNAYFEELSGQVEQFGRQLPSERIDTGSFCSALDST
jgi:tetratricopeptide (TPR) repeat protein